MNYTSFADSQGSSIALRTERINVVERCRKNPLVWFLAGLAVGIAAAYVYQHWFKSQTPPVAPSSEPAPSSFLGWQEEPQAPPPRTTLQPYTNDSVLAQVDSLGFTPMPQGNFDL